MSPSPSSLRMEPFSFPRVSGDEPPGYGGLAIGVAFSPRERG